MKNPKILIITGGYLSTKEVSLVSALRKQILQSKYASDAWLEMKIKVNAAEPLLKSALFLALNKRRWSAELVSLLESNDNFSTPELTEVVLATELSAENLEFEILTFDDLISGQNESQRKLGSCDVVFVSTTFLRDFSELRPLLERVKRPTNRVVVGGALAGSLYKTWSGSPLVDVLAIGYGELLIPALASWIRSGYVHLQPPPTGRIIPKSHTLFLFSGSPSTLSLDWIRRPNWSLIEKRREKDYRMIHYESVRGCPYRCAFCNYPYLFDDQKFRTKSALKMAEDWEHYQRELGVEYITCLDSLFTMPKARLIEFCNELLRRDVRIKWICYARADDLCDESVVLLMKAAGCQQVQIGIESGDQGQLDRMNKRTTVAQNARALENCRRHGLTTVISLVVGFPGETAATLSETFRFLQQTPPDFHFLATFSTRIADVPILRPKNTQLYGLVSDENPNTVSPYWRHDSMSCAEVGQHVRSLSNDLISKRVSLDASIFYRGILQFRSELREEMLDFQKAAMKSAPLLTSGFNALHAWIDRRLSKSVDLVLPRMPNIDTNTHQRLHPENGSSLDDRRPAESLSDSS